MTEDYPPQPVVTRRVKGIPFKVDMNLTLGNILQIGAMLAISAVFLVTTFSGYKDAQAQTDHKLLMISSDLDLTKQRLSQAEKNLELLRGDLRDNMNEIKISLKELSIVVGSIRDSVAGMRPK